jgi:hypothetical protein
MTRDLPRPGSWPDDRPEHTEDEISTSQPSTSELSEPTRDEGRRIENIAEMAIRLDGNAAFEQWSSDNSHMFPVMPKSNPPLRPLTKGVKEHECFKCAKFSNPEEMKRYLIFRDALRSRLTSDAQKQDSYQVHAGTTPQEDNTSPSRPVIFEQGMAYPIAKGQHGEDNRPEDESTDEDEFDTSIGSFSSQRPDSREFPLFTLACDHIGCQACLLFNFEWWYQNLVCPICLREVTRTEGFYHDNMTLNIYTVLLVWTFEPPPQEFQFFQRALQVSKAFVSTYEAPTIGITAFACDVFKNLTLYHLLDRVHVAEGQPDDEQGHGGGNDSYEERSDFPILPQHSKTIQDILGAVSGAFHGFFAHHVGLDSGDDVPGMVSVTQLKAAMLGHVREAAREPIIILCRKPFALELVQAGLKFDSSPEEIFKVATTCPRTRMGKARDLCVELVELTVAWLVWRHVTADRGIRRR